jgi:NAD(P)-dependent dehydrogenase (short-subunit alcohol dehydrogenase family)
LRTLEDRVVLVSGASRGIGLAVVERVCAAGGHVAALDLPGTPLTDVVALAEAAGRRCIAIEADVTLEADWLRAMDSVAESFGVLHVLVNNAGVSGPIGPLWDCPAEHFEQVLKVNTLGVFLGMKTAKALLAETRGVIVNIGSVSGLGGGRNTAAYTASKHAVSGLTQLGAVEFAELGVRVNAVCPAPTNTDMMVALANHMAPEDPAAFHERFVRIIPMGRYGEPSEIADAVVFLAGDGASFITGALLPVDGGVKAS